MMFAVEWRHVVRSLREDRGWLRADVARRLSAIMHTEVRIPTVADLENGTAELTMEWLHRFAAVYGMSISDFLNYEAKPRPPSVVVPFPVPVGQRMTKVRAPVTRRRSRPGKASEQPAG